MWNVKARVVPIVFGALGTVTRRLGEWFQQIPETTSEDCNHTNVQDTAQNPKVPGPLLEDPLEHPPTNKYVHTVHTFMHIHTCTYRNFRTIERT